jgi:hypothetical protein
VRRFIVPLTLTTLAVAQSPALAKGVDSAIGGQRKCVLGMERHCRHRDVVKPSDKCGHIPIKHITMTEGAQSIDTQRVERTGISHGA